MGWPSRNEKCNKWFSKLLLLPGTTMYFLRRFSKLQTSFRKGLLQGFHRPIEAKASWINSLYVLKYFVKFHQNGTIKTRKLTVLEDWMHLWLIQDWCRTYSHVHTLQTCVYGQRWECLRLTDVEVKLGPLDHPMEWCHDHGINQCGTVPQSLLSSPGS